MSNATQQRVLKIEPLVLEGQAVRLEPLGLQHLNDLAAVSNDEEIWRYFPVVALSASELQAWIEQALAMQTRGEVLPFAIIDKATGRAVGSSRYLNIMYQDLAVEIGATWLGRDSWRTAINTECKYLLLSHAFETLGCIRVQIKTDKNNQRSRRAVERIGGQFEGILRQHMVLRDGSYIRDTAYYSILNSEWPTVKANLEAKLSR